MSNDRPVNINLFQFKFPRMAIVSILHRISGVVLFLLTPVLLYMLHQSLESGSQYAALMQNLHNPFMKLVIWAALSAVLFHLLAGIRHMLMDLGFAESLTAGRWTATIVLALGFVAVILVGVWLW